MSNSSSKTSSGHGESFVFPSSESLPVKGHVHNEATRSKHWLLNPSIGLGGATSLTPPIGSGSADKVNTAPKRLGRRSSLSPEVESQVLHNLIVNKEHQLPTVSEEPTPPSRYYKRRTSLFTSLVSGSIQQQLSSITATSTTDVTTSGQESSPNTGTPSTPMSRFLSGVFHAVFNTSPQSQASINPDPSPTDTPAATPELPTLRDRVIEKGLHTSAATIFPRDKVQESRVEDTEVNFMAPLF